MKRFTWRSAARLLFAAIALLQLPHALSATASSERISNAYRNLPLVFEENRGQARSDARFIARGQAYQIQVADDRVTIISGSRLVGMRFAGAVLDPHCHRWLSNSAPCNRGRSANQ